jgi:serpin B
MGGSRHLTCDEEGAAVTERTLMDRSMMDRSVTRRSALLSGLALAGLPALAACGAGSGEGTTKIAGLQPLTVTATRTKIELAAVQDLPSVVAGIRHFGAAFYRANATMDANFTASPFSIAVAFGMLRAGSRGPTAAAIDTAFGFPTGTSASGAVHPALNALTANLVTSQPVSTAPAPTASGRPRDPIVAIANALFLQQGFAPAVRHDFLELLATQYGSNPIGVDFAEPKAAAATINAWVARQTRDRIKKLFDSLDPSTVLVLANAIYLKADWALQFDRAATKDDPFSAPTGTVTAPMMNQTLENAAYSAGDGWQGVAIPYAGGQLSMRVVVPTRPATDLVVLATAMDAALDTHTPGSTAGVTLTLPRWNTASNLELGSALARVGLTVPFSARADFSGIAPNLHIDQAVHRANITVDELGTEAAAVTGIGMATSASARQVVVRADRPFAWAIVHDPTGTPLFTGHVVNPVAQ